MHKINHKQLFENPAPYEAYTFSPEETTPTTPYKQDHFPYEHKEHDVDTTLRTGIVPQISSHSIVQPT